MLYCKSLFFKISMILLVARPWNFSQRLIALRLLIDQSFIEIALIFSKVIDIVFFECLNGLNVFDSAKELGRYRKTVESYMKSPNVKSRKDKEKRRQISSRDKRKLRTRLVRKSNNASASIFRTLMLLKCCGRLDAVFWTRW